MSWKFDYLIVGAGFAGLTAAERLCTQSGKRCLLVEKRDHIGGNAYDRYDDHGVLIHTYGPHYFRTNSPRIRDYLSQFTEWHPVDYTILSHTSGTYWKFPINLNTFEQILERPSTSEEMEAWLEEKRIHIENPANSEEVIISQVGWELYEKFFKGYTLKQWKRHPKDLDASVCGRIPIRTNRDDRYLKEEFQALPKAGYTRMFERMVEACGTNLKIMLNTDYREILPHIEFDHMIYTGPIDEFYHCRHGSLPYRSLRFENESFTAEQLIERESISGKAGFWQPAMQVNYPNEEEFTRIVEVKHATGQLCANTTIVREYPDDFGPGKEPYYPVPAPDAAALYQKYKLLADAESAVSFIGRLATYRYYNMDQVVGMALLEAEKLLAEV
ncbi:MAG: UDP-galactopyranose mutase [Gloeobacteraceae cyanobacterium ES-bin-144]|nr:UDP-galactopyranose mutase [Verrucomicrobiales bacterium]